MNHAKLEKNIGLMGVLIALVVSVGGLVEILPLMFQAQATSPSPGVLPSRYLCARRVLQLPFADDPFFEF
jgi:cbb3-type cytochrome oxidase cytochrome c subunit